jgi:hypothetical protein
VLVLFKRYILFILPFIVILYFYQGDNKKLSPTNNDSDIIDKTKNIVIKPHLYNQLRDGKRLEVIAERGENNNKTIIIYGVVGKIYDTDNNCILEVQTRDGEFNIQDKILNIKKDIDIAIYDNLNRKLSLKGSDMIFNMQQRIVYSSSKVLIEDDGRSLSAESFEVDINNLKIAFTKPVIKKN